MLGGPARGFSKVEGWGFECMVEYCLHGCKKPLLCEAAEILALLNLVFYWVCTIEVATVMLRLLAAIAALCSFAAISATSVFLKPGIEAVEIATPSPRENIVVIMSVNMKTPDELNKHETLVWGAIQL